MNNVKVKIYADLSHEYGLPAYAKPGDSGMDIRANKEVTLYPGSVTLIPTGLYVGLPEGYEFQVRPRSGLSLKTKLRVANSPGTIDEAYTGEICVIADNIGSATEIVFGAGERIAQLVLQAVPKVEWEQVFSKEELGTTERGAGGFGSTGTN